MKIDYDFVSILIDMIRLGHISHRESINVLVDKFDIDAASAKELLETMNGAPQTKESSWEEYERQRKEITQ